MTTVTTLHETPTAMLRTVAFAANLRASFLHPLPAKENAVKRLNTLCRPNLG
jgi:hypothetical protein